MDADAAWRLLYKGIQQPAVLQVAALGVATCLFDLRSVLALAALAWFSRPDERAVDDFVHQARGFKRTAEVDLPQLPKDSSEIAATITRWPLLCTGKLSYRGSWYMPVLSSFMPVNTELQCVNVFGRWLPVGW